MVGDNMEFYLGLFCGIVFLFFILLAFYIGYKLGDKPTPVKQDIDEQTRQKLQSIQRGVQEVMSYDVPTALKRRQVE